MVVTLLPLTQIRKQLWLSIDAAHSLLAVGLRRLEKESAVPRCVSRLGCVPRQPVPSDPLHNWAKSCALSKKGDVVVRHFWRPSCLPSPQAQNNSSVPNFQAKSQISVRRGSRTGQARLATRESSAHGPCVRKNASLSASGQRHQVSSVRSTARCTASSLSPPLLARLWEPGSLGALGSVRRCNVSSFNSFAAGF